MYLTLITYIKSISLISLCKNLIGQVLEYFSILWKDLADEEYHTTGRPKKYKHLSGYSEGALDSKNVYFKFMA